MNGKIFVDTNVLVYAYDRSEPVKQVRALEILNLLATSGAGVISTQILAEFFLVVTRKIAAPLSLVEGHERVKNYLQIWSVVNITGMVVLEAVRGVLEYQFSYWDSQIWAVARLNQIPVVLSEDFNTGTVIEGVRFANPFAAEFRAAEWF